MSIETYYKFISTRIEPLQRRPGPQWVPETAAPGF